MKIKVYANHNGVVITEKQFLAKLEEIEELAQEYDEDIGDFEDFLDDTYTIMEIWNITEDERAGIREDFHKMNVERATDYITRDWFETTLEI